MKKGNPVLQRLTPNVSRPSTPFDRGHRSNFTMNAGQLIPLFNKFVPAGTKFKINRSVFLRTNAVNTAAFSEMNFCIDFYKVPIKLLVSNWGAMQTMTRDVNSVLMQQPNGSFNTFVPKLRPDSIAEIWDSNWPYTDRATGHPALGKNDTARLFDYFNTGWVEWSERVQGRNYPTFRNNGISQNLLNFCAYQKVYFDHYRNTMYEKNDAFAYNIDDIVNAGTWPTGSSILMARLAKIMQLRYVNMRNDFFGNIYPSLYGYQSSFMMNRYQLMPRNILGLGITMNPHGESFAYPLFKSADSSVYPSDSSSIEIGSDSYNTGSNMTSVQNIRAAFALDKLLRLSNRAKQHVIDQYAARFGVAPKNEGMLESDYIGSFQNDISIGEVLQSVNTDNDGSTNLGAIGGVGRGAAPREKTISGFTDCDCYIIGVAYVIPRINYDALFVDSFNVKSAPSDFFQPEFENMGLQPIFQYQLCSFSESDNTRFAEYNNSILGYQPRYSEYKISFDENHSIFIAGNELASFVTHTSRQRNISLVGDIDDGVGVRYFKVYPQYLNSIFVEQVNESSYPSTDQFFGTIHFDFDVVQKMSATGDPSL